MNDERFFDLAMKAIARQSTDAERAELDAALADSPQRKAEFEKFQADCHVANEILPLVNATEATTGEFPTYARERLQTKVRQTLGRPAGEKAPDRTLAWGWRWMLGLATATAVVLLVLLPMFRSPSAPVIQLAMLDTTGGTRGGGTNEIALLQATWKEIPIQNISTTTDLEAWEKNWPDGGRGSIVKIIYDQAAGEVRVALRSKGKIVEKTFPLERDLKTILPQVIAFILEQQKQ